MKNINFILILSLLMTVAVSCGSDDEASRPPATGVAGNWQLTAYSVNNGESVSVLGGVEIEEQFTQTGTSFDYTVSFGNTINELIPSGSFTVSETRTGQGESTTQSLVLTGDIPSGSWALNGSTLSLTSQLGASITVEVTQVNETSLIFVLDLAQVSSQNPGEAMISGNATYTFTRL